MPIIRNPFRRQDENLRPINTAIDTRQAGSKSRESIDVKEKAPVEYQLSEINDSGVFVPPSPTETTTTTTSSSRPNFWTTPSSRSTTSSHKSQSRSAFSDNEPFNISRESFDSYRRSFDISARSPVVQPAEFKPRTSLDSRTFLAPAGNGVRHSNSFRRPVEVPGTQQEEAGEVDVLEEVALDDEPARPAVAQQQKRRGMFSRLMDSEPPSAGTQESGGGKTSWHHFGGRKRGQSGQGSELGSIPAPAPVPVPVPVAQGEAPPPAVEAQTKPEAPMKAEIPVKVEEKVAKTEERQATPKAENTQTPVVKVDSSSAR